MEDQTKVPQKFRYPYFTEMLWYVLAKYVYVLLGNAHLEGEPSRVEEVGAARHIHLTHYELFGLKEIVMFLYDLPPHKKNVPDLIRDPVALIKDVRTLVERHCKDSPEQAITGRPILAAIPDRMPSRSGRETPVEDDFGGAAGGDSDNSFVSPAKLPSGGVPINNRYGPRGPYKKHNVVGGSSTATSPVVAGTGDVAVAGQSSNNGSNGELLWADVLKGASDHFLLLQFPDVVALVARSARRANGRTAGSAASARTWSSSVGPAERSRLV